MNHYRSRHSPHDRQPESTVFSVASLDPQLDSLVESISREIASNHELELDGRSKHAELESDSKEWGLEGNGGHLNLQFSKFTSSFLFGLGMLGFALSLPALQIGSIKFDLPFLVISAFCTSIGAGCMMMVRLTQTISDREVTLDRSQRSDMRPVRIESQLEWLLGTFGILFLVSAMLVSSAYRRDLLVLPTVFRLGLVGLTCSTISLQLQFVKLVRNRLQKV